MIFATIRISKEKPMSNKFDEYEIRNAIRQAENDRQLDQQSTDLAGFVIPLIAPFLIVGVFGLMALLVGFGIPFFAFWMMDYILIALSNTWLSVFVGVILSIAFCAVDIFAIIILFPKLKTSWKGWLIIAYLIILLTVPWITGIATLLASLDTNGNLTVPPL